MIIIWKSRTLATMLIVAMIVMDFILALSSWETIRTLTPWVKTIPQVTEFKLRHIIQFAPQGFFLCGFCFFSHKTPLKLSLLKSFIVISFVGCISELLQILTESRIPSPIDCLWNVFGTFLGCLCFYVAFKKMGQPIESF